MVLRIPRNLSLVLGRSRINVEHKTRLSQASRANCTGSKLHSDAHAPGVTPAATRSSSTGIQFAPQLIVSKEMSSSECDKNVRKITNSTCSKADLKQLFQSDPSLPTKSTMEIIRALSIYHICAIPFIVRNARFLYDLSSSFIGHKITDKILKSTFFAHFCGGESENELPAVIKKLQNRGVGAILDYAAESELESSMSLFHSSDKTAYHESNVDLLISSISSAAKVQSQDHLERFAALKVTALADPSLLMKASSAINRLDDFFTTAQGSDGSVDLPALATCLRNAHATVPPDTLEAWFASMDSDKDGKVDRIDFMDFMSPANPPAAVLLAGPLRGLGGGTSADDLAGFAAASQRVSRVAQHASACRVTLMVDAEQYGIQPAIDRLALDAMARHNRHRPVVFNTYQCYLRDALGRVRRDLLRSRRGGYVFGAKVVRGAYVQQVA